MLVGVPVSGFWVCEIFLVDSQEAGPMENGEQGSPLLYERLTGATPWQNGRTWKKMLMYWSESSLGGIFEVPLEKADEEELGRED